jgi:hypothetical protein
MAARYLWNLAVLRDVSAPSRALGAAIDEGLEMAADACRAYGVAWPPVSAETREQGYSTVRFGADAAARERAVAAARAHAPAPGAGAVATRAESAYAAATLLRGGPPADRARAVALANDVVGALGDSGRLYSTVDSAAAIALLAELRAARVVGGAAGTVEVDGRRVTAAEASALGAGAREVAAVDGLVAVEVARLAEEDWGAFAARVPVAVTLERDGRPARRFTVGDAVDLRVRLEGGYEDGDLLWVCLPDALSRVVGGGQVKRFSVDFAGRDEAVVPLAATSVTVDRAGSVGPQRFAVCVRNMFEEERAGNPGLLDVTVAPPGDGGGGASALARMYESLRGLLGR